MTNTTPTVSSACGAARRPKSAGSDAARSCSARPVARGWTDLGQHAFVLPPVQPRPLTPNEVALLRRVVGALDEPSRTILDGQIGSAVVVGGIPTLLDLAIDPAAQHADMHDGPLPVRALAADISGEVLVWVMGGVLCGLEFAWTSTDAPTAMPSADAISIARGGSVSR
jgi:hypothetical protein